MDTFCYTKQIRNLREDHDYTQRYVASYLGTSQTMLHDTNVAQTNFPSII